MIKLIKLNNNWVKFFKVRLLNSCVKFALNLLCVKSFVCKKNECKVRLFILHAWSYLSYFIIDLFSSVTFTNTRDSRSEACVQAYAILEINSKALAPINWWAVTTRTKTGSWMRMPTSLKQCSFIKSLTQNMYPTKRRLI